MVKLIKKEKNNSRVMYYYQPEGVHDVGLISYYFKNEDGNRLFCEVMSSVEDENFTKYRDHAVRALLKFVEKDNYPDEITIKWY